eukprot:Plantae.Rhodophyta-Purpureofilum_apyrenoidigerum.ctg11139.p1 GENE.Plantae.Rhodophyta-Purpureofilum_apyrenoidigerum.ctg11139~~Plantae.Rhodophyta-Purpureofilum_apyrenoidigerum.ctg11139.p1  ORF type:complete len:184 (-),score=26.36 Plantae.Rhodophyta-Purpureofilum_apyrenoidigerum.ctg11139:221-772(-)
MTGEEHSRLFVGTGTDEGDFDPKPDAKLKVELHVLQKGFQLGSILGTVIALPVSLYKTRSVNLRTLLVFSGRGGLIGEVVFGILGWYKLSTAKDIESIEDRNYRLHYNVGQQRCDKYANIAAIVGATGFGAQTVLGSSPVGLASAVLGGAALGTMSGVLLHVATYSVPKDQRQPNRMIKELSD